MIIEWEIFSVLESKRKAHNQMIKSFLFLFMFLMGIVGSSAADTKVQNEQKAGAIFSSLMKGAKISHIIALKGGVSGAGIYKVFVGKKNYVLRILPDSDLPKYIQREFNLTRRMAEEGVSPIVYGSSVEKRALVMAAIEAGPLWESHLTKDELDNLGRKVRLIHQTPVSEAWKPVTPERFFSRTMGELESAQPEHFKNELAKHAEDFKELDNKFAITHTDLNPGNILKGESGIFIIDWSDAALTNPYLDLACIAIFYIHNPDELERFLSGYTKGKTQEIDKKQLNAAFKIYNLVLSLRILNTAIRLGASMTEPLPENIKEARDVVQHKQWKKLAPMLSDKDKAYALSRIFLERSEEDLFPGN